MKPKRVKEEMIRKGGGKWVAWSPAMTRMLELAGALGQIRENEPYNPVIRPLALLHVYGGIIKPRFP